MGFTHPKQGQGWTWTGTCAGVRASTWFQLRPTTTNGTTKTPGKGGLTGTPNEFEGGLRGKRIPWPPPPNSDPLGGLRGSPCHRPGKGIGSGPAHGPGPTPPSVGPRQRPRRKPSPGPRHRRGFQPPHRRRPTSGPGKHFPSPGLGSPCVPSHQQCGGVHGLILVGEVPARPRTHPALGPRPGPQSNPSPCMDPGQAFVARAGPRTGLGATPWQRPDHGPTAGPGHGPTDFDPC